MGWPSAPSCTDTGPTSCEYVGKLRQAQPEGWGGPLHLMGPRFSGWPRRPPAPWAIHPTPSSLAYCWAALTQATATPPKGQPMGGGVSSGQAQSASVLRAGAPTARSGQPWARSPMLAWDLGRSRGLAVSLGHLGGWPGLCQTLSPPRTCCRSFTRQTLFG